METNSYQLMNILTCWYLVPVPWKGSPPVIHSLILGIAGDGPAPSELSIGYPAMSSTVVHKGIVCCLLLV